MNYLKYSMLLVVMSFNTYSQSAIQLFIPSGYSILDSASGDMNNDRVKDLILILKNNNESIENNYDELIRPLLILHGTKNNNYTLFAKNDSVVLCSICGGVFGDPYEAITIKNNFFSIEHYGGSNWRWTKIITFKYNEKVKKYILHKDAGASYHTSTPDVQTEIKTKQAYWGKQLFTKYSFNQ